MQKSSKLLTRSKIVTVLYRFELFNGNFFSKDVFEEGLLSNDELLIFERIESIYDKLVKVITKFLKVGWTFKRLDPLVRALLIYGAYELTFIDKALVINEIIVLARGYIPGNEYIYINSILDKVGFYYEQIRKN